MSQTDNEDTDEPTRAGTDAPDPRSERAIPPAATSAELEIPQFRPGKILAVWVAAALPMGVLAWFVAPRLAVGLSGEDGVPMAKALFVSLTIGLIWQFALVLILIWREQRDLRWSTLREALWLRSPQSPPCGRRGGRVWLILVPLIVLFAAKELIPSLLPVPADRDLGLFLQSDAGEAFLHGAWGWFALMVVGWIFNTVLGEELLFRGLLLPRMNGTFGRADWLANGVLFAVYHLHVPWAIPVNLLDSFILSYPTRRYRSAWIGIVVHSAQSVFFAVLVLALVV